MKNSTPILVLTGLAIVAAFGIAALTRDRWMGDTSTPAVTAPQTAEAPQQPAAEQPAAEQPAAEQPATQQPAAEQPAATAEATAPAAGTTEPAATEQPAATAQPEQPASQPAAETAAPAEQPASNAAQPADVPSFDTVRVEKTGEAVIAGRAEPGSEVVIKLDGQEIGRGTANADGAFVIVPEKPLPEGSGALTIEATGKGDLNPTPSEQSVAVIVPAGQQAEALVAVVSPDAPTKVLQKPSTPAAAEQPAAEQKPAKLVSIDAVDYDGTGNIVFSGQGEVGNTARIYIDNQFVGDATVGEDGRWSFSGTADVAQGVHTLRVDGLDSGGNVLNRVEVPFFREAQAKVADATAPAASQPAAEQPAAQPEASAPAAEQPAPAEASTPDATETAAQPQQTTQTQDTAAAQAPAEPAAEALPKDGRIVIQPGNNLWRISRVLYGEGHHFTTLYEANKDQIRNPNLIYPGQVFKTPNVAPKSETVDPKRRDPLKPEETGAAAQ